DEDRFLRQREQRAERADVALDDGVPALAAGLGHRGRRVGRRPAPVLLELHALEAAVQRIVELRQHAPRHLAPAERLVRGPDRPLERARDAEVERLVADELTEAPRLLLPGRREPAGHAAVAVQQPADAELALAVPGEQQPHGKRMLRYESTRRIPIDSYSAIAG